MSLKAELEVWGAALKAYDEEDYEKSIKLFDGIADTSKVLVNVGLIYATMGEHDLAVQNFATAVKLDQHLAIGYFQSGVSNFLLMRYETAYKDFEEALLHLRLNKFIDYEQLGLKFQLWRAEVLFNKGLCQIYMGNVDLGMRDLEAANQEKALKDHDVIGQAIREQGDGYTVFSIPAGILYRPSGSKLDNLQAKNYMGKAKLIAVTETKDAYTDFVGVKRLQDGLGPAGQRLDRSATPQESGATADFPPPPPSSFPRRSPSSLTRTPIYEANARLNRNDRMASPPLPDIPRQTGSDQSPQLPTITRSATVSFAPGTEKKADNERRPSAPSTSASRPEPSGVPKRSNTINNTNSGGRGRPAVNVEALRKPNQMSSPLRNERQQEQQRVDVVGARDDASPRGSLENDDRDPKQPVRGVTQFYDSYLGAYEGDDVRASQVEAEPEMRRVAAWTSKTIVGAPPDQPPSRAPSQAIRQMKKQPSRKFGSNQGRSQRDAGSNGSASQYDEEEGRSSSFDGTWKIRIKIHYQDDTRGMAITPQTSFEELQALIILKFGIQWKQVILKFNDEDGGKVSLKDAMDWDMAIECSRVSGGASDPFGKPEGKLEMWMTDM
ncbi:hypothetical protein FRB96_001152 [Tulasnella sp. 330]|nr:hypothetical protein FRB96_001152 [Tulasnella sp. 330]KAG8875196.1 hypothetical protein FRB97_005333 [Tulasnella sp. 331]KAG8880108.1 hypothetical protein FRB98_005332 [Tulasnella sp. 332]